MSFRAKQKYRIAMSVVPIVSEETTLENGQVVLRGVRANKEMPDPEMFKIECLTKAGVSMEEVSSKVLGCRYVDASQVFQQKQTKNSKQTNEDKVNEN